MSIMEGLYDQKVTCPLCGSNYTTKKVLSRMAKVERVDGDFYAKYTGLNPNYYLVNVCTDCGFSFLEKTKPKITKQQRSRYIDEVIPRWRQRDYSLARSAQEAIGSYKLAIYCAQFFEEAAKTVGVLCLQLAWVYRDLKNEAQERRFLTDALEFYRYAYENDSSIEPDGKLTYLLGELSRRLGDSKSAILFVNQVIHDKQATPKYVRKARDQWSLLREEQAMMSMQPAAVTEATSASS